MSIQKAYNDWSASYDTDRNLTRDLDQEVLRQALANLHFKSILEIGCGTGKNTSFLSQIAESVHALDFSEGMIEKAREKVRAENVKFSIANLTRRWPSEDESHQLIVCNLVLEHIEDLSFIFSEASRVLKQKGRFLINELHPFRQYEGKKAGFSRGSEVTEIPAFVHHISDFTNAAANHGLTLVKLNEWWHQADQNKPPRIISFTFDNTFAHEPEETGSLTG
ncbi:MAG: class I SAM-dependent methyltransferase [Chloroflexi bacterium]|nr:MAG: class I SAM-dependent methyltransferase [Chloroflexota bacterium]